MVAIYARVSTDEQFTEQQIIDCVKWCEGKGVKYRVYQEKESAKGMQRAELLKMLRKVDEGKYKKVVIWKLDRLSRSIRDFVNINERCRQSDCGIVSVTQGIDTLSNDAQQKMIVNLLMIFAEWERDMIVERTKAGLNRARREGKKLGRKPVSVDAVKILRLKNEGMTVREIGKRLGVPHATVGRRLKAMGWSPESD